MRTLGAGLVETRVRKAKAVVSERINTLIATVSPST